MMDSSNLARLSRLMAWLTTIGLILAPLLDVLAYVRPGSTDALVYHADHLDTLLNSTVPLPYRLAAMAVSLCAEAFTIWALWSLRALFLLYARGEVFSPRALKLMNSIAIALFAGVVAQFAAHAPLTYLLTRSLGAGHRYISLEFGSGDVVDLFTAGVVLVIARVMAQARGLADENAKFV